MNWFDWLLVAYFSINALIIIGIIGKDREPITPTTAVFVVIIYALLIAGVIIF